MIQKIKSAVLPSFEDLHEPANMGRLLQNLALASLAVDALLALAALRLLPASIPMLGVTWLLGLTFLATYLLARAGKPRLAGTVYMLLLWLTASLVTFALGGLSVLGFSLYITIIITASLLFGQRSGAIFFGLSLLALIGALAAELLLIDIPDILPVNRVFIWVAQLVLFICTGCVLLIAFLYLRSALRRARQNAALLERRAVQVQVAAEIAREATAIRETPRLLERAVDLVQERFGYYHAAIFLIDETGQYAVMRAATSQAGRKLLETGHKLKVGEQGIIGHVASGGRARLSLDVRQDAIHQFNPLLAETRSEMALPLKVNERVSGVLDVQSIKPHAFDQQDLEVLQTVADQLAVALETAHLFEAAQRQLRELGVLERVSNAAAQAGDEDALIETVTRIIGEAFYPDNFGVILLDERSDLLVKHPSYRERVFDPAEPYQLGLGITGFVAQQGAPLRVGDVSQMPIYYQVDPETRSELCVPLKAGERVIGVVNTESRQFNAFSQADERLLATLADTLSTAILRLRLYSIAQARLRELSNLLQASAAITTSLDIDTILSATARHVTQAADAGGCILSLWDRVQATLSTRVSHSAFDGWAGNPPGEADDLRQYQATRAVLESRQPAQILAGDLQADQAEVRWMQSQGARVLLMVALTARGRVIGLLEVLRFDEERLFSADEVRVCQTLANQMAIALENAGLYQEVQRRAEDLGRALKRQQELDRLKSEFIQNVSHELRTPVSILLGYTDLFESGELGELSQEQRKPMTIINSRLHALSRMLDDLMTILEAESKDLTRRAVDLSQLAYGVVNEMQGAAAQAGLTLQSELDANLPLIFGVSGHLRRAIENLLSNAIKFTPAGGEITLRTRLQDSQIWLECIDNGIGIPPEKLERVFERFFQVDGSSTRRYGGAGLGLALVKEVVEAHGGQVQVESTPGQGSLFRVRLPTSN
jgi:signal transduction histidine kinase/putative methionine-R-sulfoxide reductase with GAF domain